MQCAECGGTIQVATGWLCAKCLLWRCETCASGHACAGQAERAPGHGGGMLAGVEPVSTAEEVGNKSEPRSVELLADVPPAVEEEVKITDRSKIMPRAVRRVRLVDTGRVYESAAAAAKAVGSTLSGMHCALAPSGSGTIMGYKVEWINETAKDQGNVAMLTREEAAKIRPVGAAIAVAASETKSGEGKQKHDFQTMAAAAAALVKGGGPGAVTVENLEHAVGWVASVEQLRAILEDVLAGRRGLVVEEGVVRAVPAA